MSYDEVDAMQQAQYEQMLQEFYEEHGPGIARDAIDSFQRERLQSYLVDNPTLIEPAVRQLENAVGYWRPASQMRAWSSP